VTDAYPALKRMLIQSKLRSVKDSREEHNQMRRQRAFCNTPDGIATKAKAGKDRNWNLEISKQTHYRPEIATI
jgi:hypothetical protein